MSIDDLEFITLLTTNPCPDWCEQESGHAYDEECDYESEVITGLSRCHTISVGKVTSSAFMGNRRPRKRYDCTIKILVKEIAEPDETGVWRERPTVYGDGDLKGEMSLEETEALAEILARAAVMIRGIEAGPVVGPSV